MAIITESGLHDYGLRYDDKHGIFISSHTMGPAGSTEKISVTKGDYEERKGDLKNVELILKATKFPISKQVDVEWETGNFVFNDYTAAMQNYVSKLAEFYKALEAGKPAEMDLGEFAEYFAIGDALSGWIRDFDLGLLLLHTRIDVQKESQKIIRKAKYPLERLLNDAVTIAKNKHLNDSYLVLNTPYGVLVELYAGLKDFDSDSSGTVFVYALQNVSDAVSKFVAATSAVPVKADEIHDTMEYIFDFGSGESKKEEAK
jgi:hypothetical protein